MPRIFRRGRVWWLQYSRDGEQRRVSLKTHDQATAAKMRRAFEAKLASAAFLLNLTSTAVPGAARETGTSWAERRWATMNSREKQAAVFALFGGRCSYCGRDVTIPLRREEHTKPDRAVMDHRTPLAGGGDDTFSNVTLACNECNQRKHDRDEAGFLAELTERVIERQP
jgi:hypothetical protein